MNAPPCAAQRGQVLKQYVFNVGQVALGKAVVFPQRDRACWAIQLEGGFVPVADDMHMQGAVVIGLDGNSQAAKPEKGWHENSLTQTEAFGFIERLTVSVAVLEIPPCSTRQLVYWVM